MDNFLGRSRQSPHSNTTGNYRPEPLHAPQPFEHPVAQIALKFVAYGTSSAVQCEESKTKSGFHTLCFDIAHAKGQKEFDWKNKLSIQLTQNELPIFISFCLGWIHEIRFDLHGGDAKKWIEFIRQDKHCYTKAGSTHHKMTATPIPYTDLALFGSLAINQYLRNFPCLDGYAALQAIGAMVQSGSHIFKKPMPARSPSIKTINSPQY